MIKTPTIKNIFSSRKPFVNTSPSAAGNRALAKAAGTMMLSSSGWRKIFARDAESNSGEVAEEDKLLIAGAAQVFHSWLKKRGGKEKLCIAVALDSRPTGALLGEAAVRTLISLGADVRYLYICAAPEVMSYVKQTNEIDGFIYITASHNPIGYNGIKFGPETGAVLGGSGSAEIIKNFKKLMEDDDSPRLLSLLLNNADPEKLASSANDLTKWKNESYKTYLDFSLEIFSPFSKTIPDRTERRETADGSIGIAADLNGSARCTSIDGEFFTAIGVKTLFVNQEAGIIPRPILPEGENLSWCGKTLEDAHAKDNSFIMGYMPDNDGDRGNLVYFDDDKGAARILKAQEVFALTCLAELSFMRESGMLEGKKGAVVVNGPTSCRIEKIASNYGVKVFRAEVGEANVVTLAQKLISEGWTIRYLGEGSNGGSITFPATVRDPLNTIGAIVRFLRMGTVKGKSLAEIIKTLPRFTTTETDDPLAKMEIKTPDQGLLKERYENIFLQQWEEKKNYLEKTAGITSWEEVNYMQTDAVSGTGIKARGSRTTGGLKILFKSANNEEKGFIWMRGSGTEPLFRVMADIEGENNPLERFLIKWQREMIEKADSQL
ncbi:MAG: phosphatidylglycerol lysyltransferase [Spirochaetia bacterium]|jgi:phosphomannomutase|nr:phosphatidylglycerol lysyltransferase [Spirochaetia bacterium]